MGGGTTFKIRKVVRKIHREKKKGAEAVNHFIFHERVGRYFSFNTNDRWKNAMMRRRTGISRSIIPGSRKQMRRNRLLIVVIHDEDAIWSVMLGLLEETTLGVAEWLNRNKVSSGNFPWNRRRISHKAEGAQTIGARYSEARKSPNFLEILRNEMPTILTPPTSKVVIGLDGVVLFSQCSFTESILRRIFVRKYPVDTPNWLWDLYGQES